MTAAYGEQKTEDRGRQAAPGRRRDYPVSVNLSRARDPNRRPFAPGAVLCLLISVLGLAAGCGRSAQAQAYARAEQAEQRCTVETVPAVIDEYRRVIALEPGSALARRAGERIRAMEARLKAEETHKHVFQEHGVD